MSTNPLMDKLRALGVAGKPAEKATAETAHDLGQVLAGDWQGTPFGDAFVHTETHPAAPRRGASPLTWSPLPEVVASWAKIPALSTWPAESFVFLDTETSGLSGGTGTYAFLVGAGRWDGQNFQLAQFFMRSPAEEAAMLAALTGFMAGAQAVVTFNGKAFDVALLRTRYRLHGLSSPFQNLAHLDVLHLARRIWRDRLASRTLQTLEREILEVTRTSEEVPGHEIPFLYFDYLRTGDARPLQGVFYHNAVDILTLARLTAFLADWLSAPLDVTAPGLDVVAAARLYESQRDWETAARLYEHGLAQPDLPEESFWQAVKRLAVLQRRRGEMPEALRWWQQAAERGEVYAMIELSKHAEHRLKDYQAALDWVERACQRLEALSLPDYKRAYWLDDLSRRRTRLQRKLAKAR